VNRFLGSLKGLQLRAQAVWNQFFAISESINFCASVGIGGLTLKISARFSNMAKICLLKNYPKSVPDIKKTPVSVAEQ
jgi:hypothetical protein